MCCSAGAFYLKVIIALNETRDVWVLLLIGHEYYVHSTHSVLFLLRIDADEYFVSHSPIKVLCLSVCIIQHCLSSVIHPLSLSIPPQSRVALYSGVCA